MAAWRWIFGAPRAAAHKPANALRVSRRARVLLARIASFACRILLRTRRARWPRCRGARHAAYAASLPRALPRSSARQNRKHQTIGA